MAFLDLLFPKRCVLCKKIGSFLCPDCFTRLSFDVKNRCLVCSKYSHSGLTHSSCKGKYIIDGCFTALRYSKTAKKLINNFKNRPFLTGLKEILSELFYESLIQNEEFMKQVSKESWQIVPVPAPSAKLRRRGYNQAEILAKELSKKFSVPWSSSPKIINDAKNVLLIDDVVATGETLLNAAESLKQTKARKVIGVTLMKE